MQEFVGSCKECGKQIYCNEGFLAGIVMEDKSVICLDCSNQMSTAYPIGTFQAPSEVTSERFSSWKTELISLPKRLTEIVGSATDVELETAYRAGGWTAKQVVHHMADAMMNAYIHFKLALTEENPTIKPYDEHGWTDQEDERNRSIDVSIQLLQSIMGRWEALLASMDKTDFAKTFVHPLSGQKRLDQYLGFCLWHGNHHLAQIASVCKK